MDDKRKNTVNRIMRSFEEINRLCDLGWKPAYHAENLETLKNIKLVVKTGLADLYELARL